MKLSAVCSCMSASNSSSPCVEALVTLLPLDNIVDVVRSRALPPLDAADDVVVDVLVVVDATPLGALDAIDASSFANCATPNSIARMHVSAESEHKLILKKERSCERVDRFS